MIEFLCLLIGSIFLAFFVKGLTGSSVLAVTLSVSIFFLIGSILVSLVNLKDTIRIWS